MSEEEKFRQPAKRWRCCSAILFLLVVGLVIALVVVLVETNKDKPNETKKEKNIEEVPVCGAQFAEDIDISHSKTPGIFHDLTRTEMEGILNYLLSNESLKMAVPEKATRNSTYLFAAELRLPPKAEVLDYIDRNRNKPYRRAKVTLVRGDLIPPIIEEYEVGPLPVPNYHTLIQYNKRRNPIDYIFKPITNADFDILDSWMYPEIDKEIGDILLENYDANFTECGDKCLTYYISFVPPHMSESNDKLMWIWLTYWGEYFSLLPLDMAILVNMTAADTTKHHLLNVWYQNKLYGSIADFKSNYKSSNLTSPRVSFPTFDDKLFSTSKLRGSPQPAKPQRGPRQVEPDGKRYKINHRYIEYLGWQFHFKMSLQTGPQLFDVRYLTERIAYEISLQEISVFYSGYGMPQRAGDYIDSEYLLGQNSRTLIPGVDCPEHATFLETIFLVEKSSKPASYKHGVCVFELNSGIPLRRHSDYEGIDGPRYFSGMPDNVLVVRSIVTVSNYDYFVDYIFHQGGTLELKATASGIIESAFYSEKEAKYGFHLHDNIVGNLHHHAFHFKADMDIKGAKNRFETVEIKAEQIDNKPWKSPYHQTAFVKSLKSTEKEATYKYNFDTPKYLLIKNEEHKSKHGVPRSYKILPIGMAKSLFTEGEGNEPSISWSRYQVAVTKHKDDEFTSSTPYAPYDAKDPIMRFQDFIDDNENIVDEDLVAWITLGIQHLPRTEDLPVTTTIGNQLQCYILPYNYFDEDPSLNSRDAIRIDLKDEEDASAGFDINRHGNPEEVTCLPKKNEFDKYMQENPDVVVEVSED